MDSKTLIEFAEREEFDELRLPPSAFEDLEEAPGWIAITRIIASWIVQRRDEMESISIAEQEGRDELKKMQGEVSVLRSILELPKVLEIDAREESEDERPSRNVS